jgi:glycosyltransferase involved in cell wall biosynthesis
MIRGQAFIVFSDDWGRHPSSCQHLFRRIAPANRVLWINTVGTRTPTLSRADLGRAAGKLREWLSRGQAPEGRAEDDSPVEVLRPVMTPFDRWRPFRRLNTRILVEKIRGALGNRGLSDPLLVTTIPNAAGVVGRLGEAATIYYCVDEFSEWPGADRAAMLEMEGELLENVDLVITSSSALFDAKSERHPRVRLLRHGVDWESFRQGTGQVPDVLARAPRPIAGFTGLADARLDVELLAALAERRPDVTFVFVGPRQLPPGPLDERPNLRFLPPVPYPDVPAVVRAFDVAMLPYLESTLTNRINPLKLREYLASGGPVVATGIPEVRPYRPWVRVARGIDEWLSALAEALAEGDSRRAERAASVREEGWDHKAEEFSALCREALTERSAVR